jgi:plasmid replication initiation protein
MQKLHKSKTPKVYKNKKLNNANFGTYNLNDYQVFLQLISKIGGVDEFGKYLQPQELQRTHILTAKEFSSQFNVELDGAYTTLKRVAKKLTETSITLEKPELFETWHISLCAEAKYNHKQGSLTVEFTPNIMPYLSQVKSKFVIYNLKEIANFGSLYSTRLYELIQEFKDTGFLIKSIEQLREICAVGKKFNLYADFKRFTFSHAVNEINSQYEIDLRFEEIKEGRKVVAIRFEFKPTFIRKGIDPTTGKERNIYLKPKQKHIPAPKKPSQLTNQQQELMLPTPDNEELAIISTTITEQKTLERLEEDTIMTTKKPRKKLFGIF